MGTPPPVRCLIVLATTVWACAGTAPKAHPVLKTQQGDLGALSQLASAAKLTLPSQTQLAMDIDLEDSSTRHPILIKDCHCTGCHQEFKWYKGIDSDKMCQYLCEKERYCVVALRNTRSNDCYLYWKGAQSMKVVTSLHGHPFTCVARFPQCTHEVNCQPNATLAFEVDKRIAEVKAAEKASGEAARRITHTQAVESSWMSRIKRADRVVSKALSFNSKVASKVEKKMAEVSKAVQAGIAAAAAAQKKQNPITNTPTDEPTAFPTETPTVAPTASPSFAPTDLPSQLPSGIPSETPSTRAPGMHSTPSPTVVPTDSPSSNPSKTPTIYPTKHLTPKTRPPLPPGQTHAPTSAIPTEDPTTAPTITPTAQPSYAPTTTPGSASPSEEPTTNPSITPTQQPSSNPTVSPTMGPSQSPTLTPSAAPTTASPKKEEFPGFMPDGARTLGNPEFNNEIKKELIKVLVKGGVIENEGDIVVKGKTAAEVAQLLVQAKLDPVAVAGSDPVVAAAIELAPKIAGNDSAAAKFLMDARNFAKESEAGLDKVMGVSKKAAERAPKPTLPGSVDCKVSAWGGFGQCSEKCGGGQKIRKRKVVVVPNNGGKECDQLSETVTCNQNPCPADCLLGQWSPWGYCTRTCGRGHKRRSRAISSKSCGHSIEATSCSMQPCPLDCVVSAWSRWSKCSQKCGGGERRRARTVVTNSANEGRECPKLREREKCNVFTCPKNCKVGDWTDWTACSQDCGQGWKSRKRPVLIDPSHGGNKCPSLTEDIKCIRRKCPLDCVVGKWDDWGKCSRSCGGGVKKRSRVVQSPASSDVECPAEKEELPCNLQPCPQDCTVSAWSKWGECDKPCGTGQKLSIRVPISKAKNEGKVCPQLKKSAVCNAQQCASDCMLSEWTTWSLCSQECGGGIQSRTRSVRMPGANGGKPCPSSRGEYTSIRKCNTDLRCDPSCSPSVWSEWTQCTKSCGGGVRSHTRKINPPPGVALEDCPAGKESVPCNTDDCPVNCVEGDWLAWSQCSEPCAGGTAQRRKKILVAAAFGGAQCKKLVQNKECNLQSCPIDCKVGSWSKFGACSVSCGDGVTKRYRQFSQPLYGGKRCPHNEEKEVCSLDPCPQDCELSAWSDWRKCSERCAGGTTWRDRRVLLREKHGGVRCPTLPGQVQPNMLQNKTCNLHPCPIPCKLSDWAAWKGCSISCGNGTDLRTRRITQQAQHGADTCPSLTEYRQCKLQPCPVDCRVTLWGQWTQCSSKCQGGLTMRTRKIVKEESMGGIACPNVEQEKACNDNVLCPRSCQIGPWSKWSDCSKECDSGIQKRSRSLKQPKGGGSRCPHAQEKRVCNVNLCPFKLELLSQDKPATQSSQYGTGLPGRATDGDTNGAYSSKTCTHTQNQKNAWWKVDLGADHFIQKVVVWNRVDCCKDRLAKFSVKLCCPWETCGVAEGDKTRSTAVYCNFLRGRYVQIELDGSNFLTLCEVQVFGSRRPPPFSALVSVGMPATQSSEGWGGPAARAVDGKTDGKYDDRSCTHTEKSAGNWWKVDLQAEYHISRVIIWNRVDCCASRLDGFQVTLCCPEKKCHGTGIGMQIAVDCHHEKGRYIQITLPRNDMLTLCEVQVFGTKVGFVPNVELISQKMPASQSSESHGGNPDRAVDGDTTSVYSQNSCTHTKKEANPWWKTDLKKNYKIDKVVVWNRSDCCASRLNGFQVKLCCPWKLCGTGGANIRNEVQCFDQVGRYVQIELKRSDFLTLCAACLT